MRMGFRFPVPLTVPHYFDFGAERRRVGRRLDSEAWDVLRELEGPFGLPVTRGEWEAKARQPTVIARARDIADIARGEGGTRLCSYGVGTGVLELALARAVPDLELVCTEFAPRTVERLRELFPEATVVRHDLLADPPVDADFHLLHRVDTEFTDAQLRSMLARFRAPVLLVPGEILSWRAAARELRVRMTRPRATRAGWVRSEAAFRSFWPHGAVVREVTVGGDRAFLLLPHGAPT